MFRLDVLFVSRCQHVKQATWIRRAKTAHHGGGKRHRDPRTAGAFTKQEASSYAGCVAFWADLQRDIQCIVASAAFGLHLSLPRPAALRGLAWLVYDRCLSYTGIFPHLSCQVRVWVASSLLNIAKFSSAAK